MIWYEKLDTVQVQDMACVPLSSVPAVSDVVLKFAVIEVTVKPYEQECVSLFLLHWQNCIWKKEKSSSITVILSKMQWYSAVTWRDPRITPLPAVSYPRSACVNKLLVPQSLTSTICVLGLSVRSSGPASWNSPSAVVWNCWSWVQAFLQDDLVQTHVRYSYVLSPLFVHV